MTVPVASLLDRCCNLQGSQTVNAQTIQGLALSPLHDAISPRILALTKPISTLAFRFITRPMRFYTLHCLCLTGLVISLLRLYSAKLSLLFHYFASQCFTLPSQLRSRPPPCAAQLYLANAHQFISKAKLVKSQPIQNASAHCLCRSQLYDTTALLNISVPLRFRTHPLRFLS